MSVRLILFLTNVHSLSLNLSAHKLSVIVNMCIFELLNDAIPSMFIMLFVLSIPLNENDDVIYCNGKSWLKSSHELDAHFTFIAFNKDEPL